MNIEREEAHLSKSNVSQEFNIPEHLAKPPRTPRSPRSPNGGDEMEMSFMSAAPGMRRIRGRVYYSLSTTLYIIIVIIAMFIKDVSTAYSFIGSLSCMLITYVLPPLFVLKLGTDIISHRERSGSIIFLLVGIIIFLVTLYANVLTLIKH